MQKLFTIDRIGNHGKLSVVRTDKGELLLEHAGTLFTEFGFAMETANWSEGEQNFIKGIIKFYIQGERWIVNHILHRLCEFGWRLCRLFRRLLE